ncbi:MAG: copper homeostasis protein CutC, partial [Erysipelotrichaceae bacterium]|nr:copper homeostasis protein CutC [Erysipelotrichaceae bacterium]
MINDILVEVCCGGIDDCLTAYDCGCDRIELNSALELGGLTPSLSVLIKAKES